MNTMLYDGFLAEIEQPEQASEFSQTPLFDGRWQGGAYSSCHCGARFSMKAPMPSSASRVSMFSTITFEAYS